MNIGVLGGTFDPIHYGHLAVAVESAKQVPLDRVYFAPSSNPPHKLPDQITAFFHRMIMVELAVDNYPHFYPSKLDYTSNKKSFTKHLIKKNQQQFPNDNVFLIIGADNITQLTTWYDYRWLLENVNIVAVNRKTNTDLTKVDYLERIRIINIEPVEISSSLIRERVFTGNDISDLVPLEVSEYIKTHGLYQSSPD